MWPGRGWCPYGKLGVISSPKRGVLLRRTAQPDLPTHAATAQPEEHPTRATALYYQLGVEGTAKGRGVSESRAGLRSEATAARPARRQFEKYESTSTSICYTSGS